MLKKTSLIIGCFLLFLSNIQAQKIQNISVALMNESIALPFTRLGPIHPGIEIGTTLKETDKTQLNVYIGGFHHERLENGFYIRGEYQYTQKIGDKIGINLPVGIGYLHSFYPSDLYEANESTGEFERINQFGRAHALINLGIGLTYYATDNFEPFIKHELGIETPFASGFPLIPHSFIKVGVNYRI